MFDITKIFCFWILLLCLTLCNGHLIRVNDIRCRTVDETFVTVTKCITQHFSKTISDTTVNVTLLQTVRTSALKLQFRKKSGSKYNPYFHRDILFDACKFLDNRAISPLGNYVFSAIEEFTNLNHSCPYEGYVVVDRFRIDMSKFKWIPTPSGDYFINSHWFANGRERFEFGIYFSFTE